VLTQKWADKPKTRHMTTTQQGTGHPHESHRGS
jgi:hypothetical protein